MSKFIVALCFFPFMTLGQSYVRDHFGGSVGVVFNFGSHINAVGLSLNGYYTDYFFQVNSSNFFYFYGSSLGDRKNFLEMRNAIGLVLLAGKKESPIDFQLDGLNHQTEYDYGLGYNYIIYTDNAGTSQHSGGFALHLKNVSVYHENDVLSVPGRDRFRTGHSMISYRTDNFKFSTGVNLWTGETRGARWEKIHLDQAPNGFKILEDLPYGKTSHGNVYVGFTYRLPYKQDVHFRLGVDSENVRHFVQNRLIHDLMFLPKKIERKSAHYPRLDEYGCAVFNKEDARPLRFYMQFGTNERWSY